MSNIYNHIEYLSKINQQFSRFNYAQNEINRIAELNNNYLKMHKMSMIDHVIRQQEELSNIAKPIIELQNRISNDYYNNVSRVLTDSNIYRAVEIFKSYSGYIDRLSQPLIDYTKAFEKLSINTREAILVLLEEGWYIDMNLPPRSFSNLADAFKEDDRSEVEELLCEYYEQELENIKLLVQTRHLNRYKILSSAIDAHRRSEYELSIPIILIQVDGICKEMTDNYLFMRPKGIKKPETALYVDQKIEEIAKDTMTAALLTPLETISPLIKNSRERDSSFNKMNRHTIMHGDSLDYNTRINSYKSISLLNYIIQIFKDVKDT